MVSHLAAVPLLAIALTKILRLDENDHETTTRRKKSRQRAIRKAKLVVNGLSALSLLTLSPSNTRIAVTTVVFWGPLTHLLSQWPRILLLSKTTNRFVESMARGGPLGPGCSKLVEVLAACLLWMIARRTLPPAVVATFALPFTTNSLDSSSN